MKNHGIYDWYFKHKEYPNRMRILRKAVNKEHGTHFRSGRKTEDFISRRYCMGNLANFTEIGKMVNEVNAEGTDEGLKAPQNILEDT